MPGNHFLTQFSLEQAKEIIKEYERVKSLYREGEYTMLYEDFDQIGYVSEMDVDIMTDFSWKQ